MGTEAPLTLQKIHKAAMQKFLDKGYRNASLRNIVKAAGVTTGAFYGYYSNKAALFAARMGLRMLILSMRWSKLK